MAPDFDEIEVVCTQCSFPTVTEYDDAGKIIGFREEPCPKTEEEALDAGWADHGMGLYCPGCSAIFVKDRAREEAQGEQTGVRTDVLEMFDHEILKAMAPDVSDETLEIFVKIFQHDRTNKIRESTGQEPLEPIVPPEPKDEAQALEIMTVMAALDAARGWSK